MTMRESPQRLGRPRPLSPPLCVRHRRRPHDSRIADPEVDRIRGRLSKAWRSAIFLAVFAAIDNAACVRQVHLGLSFRDALALGRGRLGGFAIWRVHLIS